MCEMVLGFGWINNHCSLISGCGFIVDNVNYSDFVYSSLFDCISASTLDVSEKISPSTFYLYQNHPNPFNPITQINYQLSKNSHIKIEVYDMMGKLVKTLVNEFQSLGYRSIKWNGQNFENQKVSSGVYFYSLKSESFSATKKMILLD